MRKLRMLAVLASVLAFSMFAFTRMDASDGMKYRARIAELEAVAGEQASRVAELEDELECYADTESSDGGELCSSS